MTTELSNPFSAGGGGGQFEIKVQAAFLALMVLDGPCPCLPRGTIDSVKLQSKHLGYDVDDLLILTSAPNGHHHRLLSQVKHALTFTASSSEFRDTLLAAWSDFNKQSLFDPARDAIAIVTGPQSARTISHVRPVLEWARHCASSGEFFAKIDTAQFSAQPKRDFIQTVRTVLSEADHPPSADDILWGFLKTMHVLSYDLDFAPSQDEARILTMLELARLSDSGPQPRGLWNELIILAGQLNQTAGTLSRERLAETLSPELQRILPQYRRVSDTPSIDRLPSIRNECLAVYQLSSLRA
jgi:hypothetical protein